jgi:nucleoside-diphosphate-sugar epimerase
MAYNKDKKVIDEDFNIGNNTYYTIEELAKVIWSMYGDERPFAFTEVPTKAITAIRREVDITKMKEIIGWEPKVTLEEGLPAVADWVKLREG